MWSSYVLQLAGFVPIVGGTIAGLDAPEGYGWAIFFAGLVMGATLYGLGKLVEDVHELRQRLAPPADQ